MQPAIGQREKECHLSELLRPAEGLSRRVILAGVASAATLPIAATARAAEIPDAELIELGARFEPLVDRYYVAHRSAALAQAHAEHRREFGDPADRNFEYPPEITNAFADSCERSGAHEADDVLSAI